MGRNKKIGLDYFPFDVDFFDDIKVRKLIKYQGGKAVSVYALLLCTIYKSGYYVGWDEELPFIISERTGFEEAYILEVIKSCLSIGLFNKELFDKNRILTSKGIQERYAQICSTSRRLVIITEFSLISSEEIPIYTEETHISSAESTQRKQNKTKVKNVDKEEIAANAALSKRETDFYNSIALFSGQYEKQMLRAFFDYWSEKNKSETKMRFEMQPTFEVGRRLRTWSSKNFNQNGTNQSNRGTYSPKYSDEELMRNVADGIARAEIESQE